jgi:hypothetical protein
MLLAKTIYILFSWYECHYIALSILLQQYISYTQYNSINN